MEDDFSIDLSGIIFDIKQEINLPIQLNGLTVFFDSALTLDDQFKKEAICKTAGNHCFDTAVINFQANNANVVVLKTEAVHLLGVVFY